MLTTDQVRCTKCNAPCYANNEERASFDPKTKATRITHTATWCCVRCHETVAERGK